MGCSVVCRSVVVLVLVVDADATVCDRLVCRGSTHSLLQFVVAMRFGDAREG